MKATTSFVSLLLQMQWLLVPSVTAYWDRGAAERALYYIAYMLEDVHYSQKDYDGWKIAPDCKGTRKGLWGQKGRCDLGEFLEYIWATKDGDAKPSDRGAATGKGKVNWGPQMTGAKDVKAIVGMIMGAKFDNGDSIMDRSSTPKQYGYTGNIDVSGKMVPHINTGNAWDQYLKALDYLGQRSVQLRADLQGAIDSGKLKLDNPGKDPKDKAQISYESRKAAVDKFFTLFDSAKLANEAVVELRQQDLMKHIHDDPDWKGKLGVDPVWDHKDPKNADLNWIGKTWEMNEDETIKKMEQDLINNKGLSPEEAKVRAKKTFDTFWGQVASGEAYDGHKKVIDQAKKGIAGFECRFEPAIGGMPTG